MEDALSEDIGTRIDWGDLSTSVDKGHRYDNAPIAEAIIEIQVRPSQHVSLDSIRTMWDDTDRWELPMPGGDVMASQIEFSDSGLQETRTMLGHVFRRDDGLRLVQARIDRFVFSWLPPYDRWEVFRDEARDAWSRYREVASPEAATRLAVRFVNRIDVPRACVEVKDYLRTSVEISPYLPQTMAGFFMQVEVPLRSHEVNARIITTLAEPTAPDRTSLVLDIDAFRSLDMALGGADGDDFVWSVLDVLRDAKNFVFESCITDATRGLID